MSNQNHFDIIIIGSGAGGGTMARALAPTGKQILILERGDFIPREKENWDTEAVAVKKRYSPKNETWYFDGKPFRPGHPHYCVGGSTKLYGATLLRLREQDFEEVEHAGGISPAWPINYADLEPYYDQLDRLIGIAGPATVPFIPRRQPHPMPPLRPFRLGEFFSKATTEMGLHPYPVPVGINSEPYDNRPALTYTAWSNGFGSFNDAKWQPGLTSVPEALETGNFCLRTHCRVVRILTDAQGHADGVEYVDQDGELQIQRARTVILSSYTFENIRLLLLSGEHHHPNGLGNNNGQVGQNFMTKMFAHVDGYFPDIIFNRHTGPAAQGVILDDFLAEDFDSWAHGFIGGATLGAEQQQTFAFGNASLCRFVDLFDDFALFAYAQMVRYTLRIDNHHDPAVAQNRGA